MSVLSGKDISLSVTLLKVYLLLEGVEHILIIQWLRIDQENVCDIKQTKAVVSIRVSF